MEISRRPPLAGPWRCWLLSTLAAFSLLAGCGTPAPTSWPQAEVLILTPQGVAPSDDSVGFNELVRKLTQAFSAELADGLRQRHHSVVNVLDQDPKLDTGQKLSLHSVRHGTRTVIVLSLATETVDRDDRLLLLTQYIEQDFTVENGSVRGVRPTGVLKKTYLLSTSADGVQPGTVTELADDYVAYLKAQGRPR